jgi:hypothetical protein
MAFTRKKKRRIIVDGHLLYWVATGDDGWINLSIMSDVEGAGIVFASFDYHHIQVPLPTGGFSMTDQFVITPYIVRQVAQLALAQGWKPLEKGKNLHLGSVDSRIDLRLDQNRVSCFRKVS